MEEAFLMIEDQTDFQFYFQQHWIDSLQVSGIYQSATVTETLQDWLSETRLLFYRDGTSLILLDNVQIIDQPAILQVFEQNEIDDDQPAGFIFSQEYSKYDNGPKTVEIGNRKLTSTDRNATIAGYVRTSENEPVEGALIYTQDTYISSGTDKEGFYSLTLPIGRHTLIVQYVGLKTKQYNLILFSNGQLSIEMDVDVIALQEITVESNRDENVTEVKMGISKISMEEAKNMPIVLGEQDVLKIAVTKPGVQTVGEGASGINVRGGKPDQNLILLEQGIIYNPNHFFGFFSVFNSDAIAGMDLYKASIPANYDSRLSSVFDIKMRTGDKEQLKGMFSVSPITSKLTVEIPILKNKTSLLASGRTTYSNWILSNVANSSFKENRVSFYDGIVHIDHDFSDKSHLELTTYSSSDKFRLSSDTLFSFSNFSYQNQFISGNWSYSLNDRWKSRLLTNTSQYRYELLYDESVPNSFKQFFGLRESSVKAEFDFFPNEKQQITMGLSGKKYKINPGEKMPLSDESIIIPQDLQDETGFETALFASNNYDFREKLTFYGGFRYVVFNLVGPQIITYYRDDAPKSDQSVTETKDFERGKIISTNHGPEWRFSSRYQVSRGSSVKLSLSRNRQYIHSLSNTASLSPTDTWRLSSPHIKPQIADQVSLGYYRNFFSNSLELSMEGYYKWIQNLVDFKVGADLLLNSYLEREILQGNGRSYGLELSLQKSGRLNGWINYTYARSFIRIQGDTPETDINNGAYYPTNFDKPHNLNIVSNYKITRRFSCSINTTYNTGRPVTLPVGTFVLKDARSIFFSDRNNYRIPDYFRMDLGLNLEGNHRIKKLAHTFWSLSIYNITGRDNPFSVFVDVKDNTLIGSQLIVFGDPIPTLSFNAKF
jgi:hypothetical protein